MYMPAAACARPADGLPLSCELWLILLKIVTISVQIVTIFVQIVTIFFFERLMNFNKWHEQSVYVVLLNYILCMSVLDSLVYGYLTFVDWRGTMVDGLDCFWLFWDWPWRSMPLVPTHWDLWTQLRNSAGPYVRENNWHQQGARS